MTLSLILDTGLGAHPFLYRIVGDAGSASFLFHPAHILALPSGRFFAFGLTCLGYHYLTPYVFDFFWDIICASRVMITCKAYGRCGGWF
jgi:hypothetical protein